ncbi:ABC transporter substrate-binding protein [Curvibacter sp. APW13]|uniref:ABC transporter substrate-binding protein n=1 Tax=Curvibacter sp. APW13 TaxID=3077236 RepID=UPI0028DF2CF8|nr:ABC transporter substrate-binding protein [Curvibacter sp. APW13]MDT8991266.1 ABC transporter substrate-binding protein [Curvibacter sp. APW13]
MSTCMALMGLLAFSLASAEPGVTPSIVRFGVLMPLSSAFAEVGVSYYRGARAAFEDANRAGGIAGRKVHLVALDTLPVPQETVAQAKDALTTTIADEQVVGLIGAVGLPSVAALVPVLESHGVPLIGAATGLVSQVRDPAGWVFPVRRGDEEVMEGMVRLLSNMSVTQLAVVLPRSPDAARQVQLLRESVKSGKVSLVAQVEVGDTSIELAPQVAALMASKPEAVLSLGSYQMTEALVRQMRSAGYKGLFVAHSDVGTRKLIAALKDGARGMGVVSGLPSPNATHLVVGREYRTAMERLAEGERVVVDEASFEGYLAARVALEGLKQLGTGPTRRGLRYVLANQPIEVSGLRFDYRKAGERGLQSPGSLYVVTGDGRISQ